MWDDDMTPEDALVEPIRAKIEAMAYLLWKQGGDLPKEAEAAINEAMEDIKRLISQK